MALFRVVHTDGTKLEISTTMGDAIAAERRGADLQKAPLEGGMRLVYAALARIDGKLPAWREFDQWTNTVDTIESDSGVDGPDPTQPAAPDTP